jgi:hypothetical protein
MAWKFYSSDGSLLTKVPSAATATEATNVTASANNSANETVYPTFVDGATGTQGIETDTGLTYNPSTGVLTTTSVTGNLTGNVTGNTSGSAGSATGNAATATALASARTIGGVSFDGTGNIDLPGVTTAGNQATSGLAATATLAVASTAATVTVNDATAENNLIPFVANAGDATGNHGLEMDTDFHYNPNTGVLTVGSITGGVTGSATQITVTAVTDDDTVYPVFATGTSGANTPEVAAALTYNPSTGLLSAVGLTLSGNLIVNGSTVTLDTATLAVEDPLIILASGNDSADAIDIGLYGLYDTSGSLNLYAGLFRDANDSGKWKLFKDLQAAPTTTVNTGGTGYAVGTLVATIEGNVTGNVTGNTSGTAATVTGGTQASITAVANVVTVGDLDAGSITSGFGTIDTGSSTLGSGAITSTGTVTGTGFIIGSASIDEAELEILDGATVTTTELNLIDGGTARGTNAVATGDGILINDAGTMHMTNVDTVSTYFASHSVGGGNIVTTGALNSGSITSGFTSIDIGSGALSSGNITSSGSGATSITSTSTSAEGILLHANGGASETIKLHSDQGTGNDSIELLSDVGGISLDVADGKLIKLGGATVFDDEVAVAYNSGNPLVDCTLGNKFNVTMSGNVTTLFFTNPGSTVSGNYMVRLIHSGGARTIGNYYHTGGTTKVHFAGGTAPTLTATSGAEDILALYWDGASFHATIMLDSKAY